MLHSRNGGKGLVHSFQYSLGSCNRALRLERVHLGESRHAGNFLIDFRIVLHRAGSQRVKTCIDAEIHLAEIGIMAHHLKLTNLWKLRFLTAHKFSRKLNPGIRIRQGPSLTAALRKFEYQFIVVFHILTSLTMATRPSISSRECFSVTQKVT